MVDEIYFKAEKRKQNKKTKRQIGEDIYLLSHLGPCKNSLNFSFPTKYVILKSLSRLAIG